jgi:hypothetical protein
MDINVEKIKVMRTSRYPPPVKILIYQKQAQNVDYFNHLGSMITNDATFTREIKSMIAMAREALNKKKKLFNSKLDWTTHGRSNRSAIFGT